MNKSAKEFYEWQAKQVDTIIGLIDPDFGEEPTRFNYIHDPYKNDPFAEAQRDLEDLS